MFTTLMSRFQRTKASLSSDLGRQEPRTEGAYTAPSFSSLLLRGLASAHRASRRPLRRARRGYQRAASRLAGLERHQLRTSDRLRRPGVQERAGAVRADDVAQTHLGWLRGLYIASIALVVFVASVTLSDPVISNLVFREALDVPVSTPVLDVTVPANLVALAQALVLAGILVGFAHTFGQAGAALWFHRGSDANQGSLARFPRPARAAIAIVSGVVLMLGTYVAYRLAHYRFVESNQILSAIDPAAANLVGGVITLLMTVLPLILAASEFINAAPGNTQARAVRKWRRQLARWEAVSTRVEAILHARYERARARATHRGHALVRSVDLVSLGVDAEVVEAAISTGKVDADLAARWRSQDDVLWPAAGVEPLGTVWAARLVRSGVADPEIGPALTAIAGLPEMDCVLPREWQTLWVGETPAEPSVERPADDVPTAVPLHIENDPTSDEDLTDASDDDAA